jgi:hypothetical protein
MYYETTPKLNTAIKTYSDYITQEVLAIKMDSLAQAKDTDIQKTLNVNKESITVNLKRIKKGQ